MRWLESGWSETELDQMELEENGRYYVGIAEGQIVGSIGCYLPTPAFDRYVVSYVHSLGETSIAKTALRRQKQVVNLNYVSLVSG